MKKEKKEVVCIDDVSYGIEEVKELLQRNEALVTSGDEMGKVITSLNRQIGGYKTSNARYKKQVSDRDRAISLQKNNYEKQIEDLQNQLEKEKAYSKEGNELNEKSIAEIESLNKQIDKLVLQVSDLADSVDQLKKDRKVISETLDQVYGERDQYKANYEHVLSLPWYKRIFLKKPDND